MTVVSYCLFLDSFHVSCIASCLVLTNPFCFARFRTVMADLRVLEQQQRESQRELAASQLTKQHKLEEQAHLESHLSSLKYANGEQRAQLARARTVLSQCTRELGACKLLSSKSGDALKGFDARLKRALATSRALKALIRKINAQFVIMRGRNAERLKERERVLQKMNAVRQEHASLVQEEESLRKDIQQEKHLQKNLLEETTNIRSDVNGLCQDLAAAQEMEASTKLRAESIETEVVAEDKRHEAAMQELRSKIQALGKLAVEKKARQEAMQKEVELKKNQLLEAWKRCVAYQQEEGHELSPEPSDDGPAPSLNVEKLEASMDDDRTSLVADQVERDQVKASMSAAQEDYSNLVSQEAATNDQVESIRKEAQESQQVEDDRREGYSKSLEELEKERQSVQDLRRSVAELEETNGSDRKRDSDRFAEQNETIEKLHVELEQFKEEMDAAAAKIEDMEQDDEEFAADRAREVHAAKQVADSKLSKFEDVRREAKALEAVSNSDIDKEVEDIEQAQNIMLEEVKEEIAQLLEGTFVSFCFRLANVTIALSLYS